MAVKYELDEGARDKLDQRVAIGVEALNLADTGEERETQGSDIIADILTALFGPAGYCVVRNVWQWQNFSGPASASVDVPAEVVLDEERCTLARTFLDMALESWEGDAEDYTATLVTVDNPLLPSDDKTRTITLSISESELAERLGVPVDEIDAQDYFGAIRDFGEIVSHED